MERRQSPGHLMCCSLSVQSTAQSDSFLSGWRVTLPFKTRISATAWQKPESQILNKSDHSLGVHLNPTAQVNVLWSHCVSEMVTTALPQAGWGGNRPKQLGSCSCWDEKGCLWHQAKWIQFPQLLGLQRHHSFTLKDGRIQNRRGRGESHPKGRMAA